MIARKELRALRDADTLHRLPKETLVASVQDLASASLDLADAVSMSTALLAEAAEVLRAFVEVAPLGASQTTGEPFCWYCEGKEPGHPTWGEFEHIEDCIWVRAKPLLDKLGERE